MKPKLYQKVLFCWLSIMMLSRKPSVLLKDAIALEHWRINAEGLLIKGSMSVRKAKIDKM